jgi:hypothetical protein
MVAFRFLALLTVGLSLLTFVFLLNVSNARLEREALRQIVGEPFALQAGDPASWTLDLGGARVESAWPGEQRQPRLSVRAEPGAKIAARATYRAEDGGVLLAALVDGERVVATADPDGLVSFGALWLSWEHPLTLEFEVLEGGPGEGVPFLSGQPTRNFMAARAISRTLWIVFTIIGAMGFAVLVATQRDLFGAPRGSARA